MRKVNKYYYIIIAFLLGIIAVMFGGGGIASADNNSGYSNVADDLQKDENFNVWDYPAIPIDYSLQVIQIAESTSGELFIYVYQPSGQVADLRATCVNMLLSEEVTGTDLYNLKYVNSSGVFYKYVAEGVKVSSAAERFYNITSILRKWNKDYDKGTGNDNTIDEVAFEVGRLFKATTANGKVTYENIGTETITITDKYVSFVRCFEGWAWFTSGSCDSHFVAFSTDKLIEKLYEVELSFVFQPCYEEFSFLSQSGTLRKDKEEYLKLVLTDREYAQTSPYGWLRGKKEEYCRIQSSIEFCSSVNLDSNVEEEVLKKQWVLRFYESSYTSTNYGTKEVTEYTKVNEVSILRLKFETAGKVYNLGVVDNKQSGSLIPANKDGLEWWQILLIVIACVLVLSLVLKLLSLVAPVFGVILSGLWWLITSPFRLIIWIVKKIRGDE